MELLLYLHQTLPHNASTELTSLAGFPRGMFSYLAFRDPERSDLMHEFVFQIVYLADEEHLLVLRGSYWRHTGVPPEG
jgi:hypothetical protein